MWGTYRGNLGGFGGAFPVLLRPHQRYVRGYLARRELVVHLQPNLILAWYHAISGGHSPTAYDLYDVLNWLRRRANAAGGRQIVVLMGDLNLTPARLQFYFASGLFAPLTVPAGPPLLPPPVGAPAAALALPPNTSGILATGQPTHTTGNELDYAVVMHIDPAPPAPAVNVNAFIQCGHVVGAALGAAPAGAGPFGALALPAFTTTDHRPIKVQIDH